MLLKTLVERKVTTQLSNQMVQEIATRLQEPRQSNQVR